MKDEITINLVDTNFFTRYPCTVCGGCTDKVGILAEGIQPLSDDGEYRKIRVCERCLEAGDIDSQLEQHARQLEAEAGLLREMIGRLKVPTFAEWCKAERDHEVRAVMFHNEVSRDQAENKVPHDYPRALDRPLFDGDGEELPF